MSQQPSGRSARPAAAVAIPAVVTAMHKDRDWRRLRNVCAALHRRAQGLETTRSTFTATEEQFTLEVVPVGPYARVFFEAYRSNWSFVLALSRHAWLSDYDIDVRWIVEVLRGATQKAWDETTWWSWGVVSHRAVINAGGRHETFSGFDLSLRRVPSGVERYLPWPSGK